MNIGVQILNSIKNINSKKKSCELNEYYFNTYKLLKKER